MIHNVCFAFGYVMGVISFLAALKTSSKDTGWSDVGIPPKFSPFPKTRNTPRGWRWRAANIQTDENKYILLVQVNEGKGEWKAWLILCVDTLKSVIARLEYHESHGGLHLHLGCHRNELISGPVSIESTNRLPLNYNNDRRKMAWLADRFWSFACAFFRVEDKGTQQDLFEGNNL